MKHDTENLLCQSWSLKWSLHWESLLSLNQAMTALPSILHSVLINGGADIQSNGGRALISAAFSALQLHEESKLNDGQIEAVRILVDAGADVDEQFDNGITALMLMSILRQTETVRVLLEAGADVNATNNADGETPLIFAVYGGSTETVSLLIESGADVSAIDAGTGNEDGRTALSYAKEKEHAEITEVLKQAGAK